MSAATEPSYCAREVERLDPERHATVLFAPPERREALLALYAFNLEVAKTAEVVSEAMLGHIRLQWWREAIAEIYEGTPRQHAVIQPLARAVQRHGLSRARFEALIDAREADLDPEPPATLAELETYAEASSGQLSSLAVEILAGDGDSEAGDRAAGSVGTAWALVGLARAVPFHARQKRCYIPADRVAATGLDLQALFELKGSPALADCIAALLDRARGHLADARSLRSQVPRAAHSALLLAGLADRHIGRFEHAGCDPFAPVVAEPLDGVLWRLALKTVWRRF